jgi:small-conductance mechanosensitive channel
MVVKTASEYIADQLIDRIRQLQTALNQAEEIMMSLEQENKRLKDALIGLASENKEGYVLNGEAFDEPVFAI